METTKVLVRGTGSIGQRHLGVFRDHVGVQPVAFPVRPERAAELRSRGFSAVRSLGEAAEQGPAAVVVATDTGRHLKDSRELLALGDLLIEKPLAPSAAGLADLHRAATAVGRRMFVAYCLRFDAGLQAFRERLPEIGRVDSVRIESQSFLPAWRPQRSYRDSYSARADEGGVLRDLSHEVDYAVWLFGHPERVFGLLGNSGRLGIEAEESADLAWTVPGGPTVSIRLDYLSPVARRRLRATGDLGEVEWDGISGEVELRAPGRDPVRTRAALDRDGMMARQARAFLRAAAGGGGDFLATFEEAAFVASLCDAVRESSARGTVATIGDWREM